MTATAMKTSRPAPPTIEHIARLVRDLAASQRESRRRIQTARDAALEQIRRNSAKLFSM